MINQKELNKEIQKFLLEYSKNHELNGTILVATGDDIVATASFGIADATNGTPCTTNTQYLIGSVTKQFTAAALLKALYAQALIEGLPTDDTAALEARIKKDLHKPISSYLPADHSIWAGRPPLAKHMPDWADRVTLHQLLTHSSGIANYTELPDFMALENLSEMVGCFKVQQLNFEPGSKYSYCNSGYILLGEIVKEITKESLANYMNRSFFIPLKMNAIRFVDNGTFEVLKADSFFSRLARGYEFDITVEQSRLSEVKDYLQMHLVGAAGGIISTALDLMKWNNALYNGKVIPEFLLKTMLIPYMPLEATDDEPEGGNGGYGYGIIKQAKLFGPYHWHNGGITGFNSFLGYIPSFKLSIICFANVNLDLKQREQLVESVRSTLPAELDEHAKIEIINKYLIKQYPGIIENTTRFNTTSFAEKLLQTLEQNEIVRRSLQRQPMILSLFRPFNDDCITEHRHESPKIQQEYDKRFGLVLKTH